MIDANQRWDVAEAISWVSGLAEFKPLWIEEPTSPDDILGHAAISKVRGKLDFPAMGYYGTMDPRTRSKDFAPLYSCLPLFVILLLHLSIFVATLHHSYFVHLCRGQYFAFV